jgi:ABC-type phosphate transport system substrate-binding protein
MGNFMLTYTKRCNFIDLAALLLCGIISACAHVPITTPSATQQAIRILLPAALQPLAAGLQACAAAQPEIVVFVEETEADSAIPADLTISLGEPAAAPAYAVALASEDLLIVINPKNKLDTLSAANLRSLYVGEITTWENGRLGVSLGSLLGEVQVWDYPASDSLHKIFQRVVLKDGLVTSLASLVPTPAAMLEAISTNPQAVGYLPRAWLKGDQVHEINVDADVAAALDLPILALADHEPIGALRTFVACLQTGKGQTSILAHYRSWDSSQPAKP